MTEGDIQFRTIPGEDRDGLPGPSEEDWAVLVSGRASDWLRAQFLRTCQDDPDAADRLAMLLDPGFRAAVEEAGELVRAPLPTPQISVIRGEGASALSREVAVRLRANLAYLFGGCAALAAGYVAGGPFFWMGFAGALVLFLLFAGDYLHTHPVQQAKQARSEGDIPKAEALEAEIERVRQQRAGNR